MNRYALGLTQLSATWVVCAVSAQCASVTLAASANPSTFGKVLTLTATVSPSTATGKVTFYDGTIILGMSLISHGAAVLGTAQMGYGNRLLRAHYSGDNVNSPASSASLPETVPAISGAGFPTFNPNPVPSNVNFIATGDFNRDGNLDLVLTMVNQIIILLGRGDGTFAQGQPFSAGNVTDVTSVAVGDFNGDGVPDLAISDYSDVTPGSANLIWILLGTGNGQFSAPVAFPVSCAPLQVVVADVNQDGIADLVAVGSAVGVTDITVLLGYGNGTFHGPVNYATANASAGAIALTIGDFNGDQIPDLAVLDTDLSILTGNGDGTFGPPLEYSTGMNPIGISSGDFNSDGIPDLVVANNNDGTVSVLLGQGHGKFQQQTPYAVQFNSALAYPSSLTVGDFNGDNISDVAVANYEDGQSSLISIMLGTGYGALESAIPYAGGAGAEILVQGDFNNDGSIDLAVADGNGSTSNGNVGVLLATRCYFGVSSPPLLFDANGGTTFLNIVTTAGACGWSASVNPPGWAFLNALSGFGAGQVLAVISTNTTGIERAGSVGVSGLTLPMTQRSTVQTFTDVTPTSYQFDAVNLLKGKSITSGCSLTDYCPNEAVSRAQMAIFMVRALYNGSNTFPYSQVAHFADVAPTDFGFPWIQRMYEVGITGGCDSHDFCPNDTVTRAQMAIFLIRARYGASTLFTAPATPYFTDVTTSTFGYQWIQRLREDNITGGCSATMYCPDSVVTRGDMAIFVMRGEFNQLLPAGQPAILSITPAILARGASAVFTVSGVATKFVQDTTAVLPVGGVTATGLTVTSDTSFTVTLTTAQDAPQQPESIYVQTGMQEAVLPSGLLVQ